MVDLERFVRQPAPRAFAGGVRDVPTLGDETMEAATEAEFSLDRIMAEIVQREERRAIFVLSLPRRRTVGADTSKKSSAVFSLGKLENQAAAVYKPPKS